MEYKRIVERRKCSFWKPKIFLILEIIIIALFVAIVHAVINSEKILEITLSVALFVNPLYRYVKVSRRSKKCRKDFNDTEINPETD